MQKSLYVKVVTRLLCSFYLVSFCTGLSYNRWYRNTTTFQENAKCNAFGTKYAIIIHGWRESCRQEWAVDLKRNLEKYRGGCIMCMDYEATASNRHYLFLAFQVDYLVQILKEKLEELEKRGFDPKESYIFGFSLGARIAIRAGTLYGPQRLGEIDACDMAGPGFDFIDSFEPTRAAKNVQCIHTSKDKGTLLRNCHQNWNMGVCGMYQLGASVLPGQLKSHGMCPRYYNSAFSHDFYAEDIPAQCTVNPLPVPFWPKNYKMGYMEKRKYMVRGQLYAATNNTYPYTTKTKGRSPWKIVHHVSPQVILFIDYSNRIYVVFGM